MRPLHRRGSGGNCRIEEHVVVRLKPAVATNGECNTRRRGSGERTITIEAAIDRSWAILRGSLFRFDSADR
jgi:hypothetical protein